MVGNQCDNHLFVWITAGVAYIAGHNFSFTYCLFCCIYIVHCCVIAIIVMNDDAFVLHSNVIST